MSTVRAGVKQVLRLASEVHVKIAPYLVAASYGCDRVWAHDRGLRSTSGCSGVLIDDSLRYPCASRDRLARTRRPGSNRLVCSRSALAAPRIAPQLAATPRAAALWALAPYFAKVSRSVAALLLERSISSR